jgi:predicted RNA-binding Zn-ribbon protein involved in translation (DUF1610 family)
MMHCPSCNAKVSPTAKACPDCGMTLRLPATGATHRLRSEEPSRPSMQRGICPACGATTIYSDQQLSDFLRFSHNTGNLLSVGRTMLSPKLTKITTYACASCGYLERYILEAKARDDITRSWTYIPPDAS